MGTWRDELSISPLNAGDEKPVIVLGMDKWQEHLRELKEAIKRAERNTAALRNVLGEVDSLLQKRKASIAKGKPKGGRRR
jgi:hypothetical protein